jgi:predicted PurR-regulated permease PerM
VLRAWRFWVGGIALVLALLWLLSGILLPFAAGFAIAYLLNPAVDRLERWHVPRGAAAGVALLVFLLALALVLALILPVLELQAAEVARRAPDAIELGRERLQALLETARQRLSPDDLARLRDLASGVSSSIMDWAGQLAERVVSSGLALANLLSLVFVTPIVAFFLLRDWHRIVAAIDRWLPRRQAETIRAELRRIDATLSGFVHGQFQVGVALALYYGVALTLAGLDFAAIVGIVVGLLSFVPVVGIVTALALSLGLCLVQFGVTWKLAVIVAIFAFGQFMDSAVLSPRLLAGRVELHPVWVIFALLAFGSLFGLLGVLLAVPMAAAIGVLVRFALARYLASPLYDPER